MLHQPDIQPMRKPKTPQAISFKIAGDLLARAAARLMQDQPAPQALRDDVLSRERRIPVAAIDATPGGSEHLRSGLRHRRIDEWGRRCGVFNRSLKRAVAVLERLAAAAPARSITGQLRHGNTRSASGLAQVTCSKPLADALPFSLRHYIMVAESDRV